MTGSRRAPREYLEWFVWDKPNAAGRMGLYRVYFSLFYLWRLSNFQLTELNDVTPRWAPPALFTWVPQPPSVGVLECALAAALGLLLFGIATRVASVAVLLLGLWFEICRMNLTGIGLAMFVLAFWVPVIMVFSDWGATYSVDNLLRRRAGRAVDPRDPSGHHFWPARSVMVCISALYFTAGLSKIQGTWLDDPHFVRDFLLTKNVLTHLENGAPLNPLVPWIASSGFLTACMQYGGLLFETLFPVVVFSRTARGVFFRFVPMFHAMNMFLFGIPVVEILCVYGAFVDWQALLTWAAGGRFDALGERLARRAGTVALGLTALALLVGVLWNSPVTPRALLNVGGLLQSYQLWVLVTAVAVVWWTVDLSRLVKRIQVARAPAA